MKLSNKILLVGAIICAFCIGTLTALFIRVSVIGSENKPHETKNNTSAKAENNTSETIDKKQNSESYLLKLKDSVIYAYIKLPEGKDILWNSTPAPPTLSKKEKETLENGITTKSFEELCLYFESYSS